MLPPSPSASVDQPRPEPPAHLRSLPVGVSYTTIAEVLRRPALFQGQVVRLKGRVGEVQTAHPAVEPVTQSFTLVDRVGNTVTVEIVQQARIQTGQELTVEGTLSIAGKGSAATASVILTDARILPAARKDKGESSAPAASGHRGPPPPPSPDPKPRTADEGRVF